MTEISDLEQAFTDYHDAVILLIENPNEENYLDAVIDEYMEEVMA